MKNRLKEIRKTLGLNQTEFGARVGVKQGSVAAYECGARAPLDTVILAICREFGVNESWLRYGDGDMFVKKSRDDQIAAFFGDVLKGDPDFRRRFVSVLARMTPDEWAFLERKAKELMDEP